MTGKVVAVTGGADGIGLRICRAFGEQGDRLFLLDMNAARLDQAVAELGALGYKVEGLSCNVADPKSVAAAADKIGAAVDRVDVLVNNAGIAVRKPVDEMSFDLWRNQLAVNLSGPFLVSKALKPLLSKSAAASVINIASVGGFASAYGFVGYAATKSGVHGLTRALAVEWGSANIRVNSISPGSVGTAMSMRSRETDPAQFDRRVARVPLKVDATADDVAAAAIFLASHQARFITGIDLRVDGGITACHPGYVP